MLRGVNIEEIASQQWALIFINRRQLREGMMLKRNNEGVRIIKLNPTNLKVYTSIQGRHSVIMENFSSADIASNLELETQLGLKAVLTNV